MNREQYIDAIEKKLRLLGMRLVGANDWCILYEDTNRNIGLINTELNKSTGSIFMNTDYDILDHFVVLYYVNPPVKQKIHSTAYKQAAFTKDSMKDRMYQYKGYAHVTEPKLSGVDDTFKTNEVIIISGVKYGRATLLSYKGRKMSIKAPVYSIMAIVKKGDYYNVVSESTLSYGNTRPDIVTHMTIDKDLNVIKVYTKDILMK